MVPVNVFIINGTVPAKYQSLGIVLNETNYEWYRAFDGNLSTFWNSETYNVPAYIFLTFDKLYRLNSLQLTVTGGIRHDPETMDVFFDENGQILSNPFHLTSLILHIILFHQITLIIATHQW
jgi:hypothetical protein